MKLRSNLNIIVVALATALAGCAVGPDFKHPSAPAVNSFTEEPLPAATATAPGLAGAAQAFQPGAKLSAEWWTLFHSEPLNATIGLALAHSPNLASAQATLREAQENLISERGSLLWPNVSGSLQDARERASFLTTGVPGGSVFNLYNASLNVSYTVDLFGASRRAIEATGAVVDYQQEELEAAYLTLVSNVVTTSIREASLRAQIKVTHDLIDAQSHQADLIEKQFRLGAIAKANLLAQQVQVAQTRATLPPLEKALAQNRHLLSVLVGQLPSDAGLPEFTLESLQLPVELPVSLPSELVRQRPDVRAAEALLHQASAQVGVATANLYPQLSISGNYGSEATKISDLFRSGFTVWSIGAGLTQPLFNGGSLTAKRRASIAALDVANAQYQQTVLSAFGNVADALSALEFDATALQQSADADALSQNQLDLITRQYKLGAIGYIPLLDAERQYQQVHINLVQAEAARYADTAALFQALGGGWWNRTTVIAPVTLAASVP